MQKNRLVSWGLITLALLIAVYGVTHFIAFAPWVNQNSGMNLLLLAMVLFGVGLWLGEERREQVAVFAADADSVSFRRGHREAVMVGALLLLIVAEINGYLLKITAQPVAISLNLQFVLWGLGILLLAWGLSGGWAFAGFRWQHWTHEQRLEIGLIAMLTLVGLVVRSWRIGESIPHFVDEMNFANGVGRVWDNPTLGLLQPLDHIATFPRLYTYLQLPFIELYGRNLAGLRMLSAVFGALGIPACYSLAKQLTNRDTALVAAMLLLTFPPHLHFSRSAFNNIADPLFGALALAFITRALWTGSRVNYVWAGVTLGLTQYFYEGGRLVFPALFAGWVVFNLIFLRHRIHYPKLGRSLVVCAVCVIAVGGPIYYTLIGNGQPIGSRFSVTGGRGTRWSELPPDQRDDRAFELIGYVGALMVAEPEITAWFYAGDTPTLLIFLTPFFVLGFAYAIRYWYQPDGVMLLVWILVPTAVASLFLDQFVVTRIVVCFPAIMILTAIGLREVVERVLIPLNARQKRILIAVVTVVLCGIQFHYYYSIHIPTFMNQHSRFGPAQQPVIYAASLPDYTVVHLIESRPFSELISRSIMMYLNDTITVFTRLPQDINEDYLEALSEDALQAFIIAEGNVPPEFVEQITQRYPVHQRIPIQTPWTWLENYVLYLVPPIQS